MSYDAGRFTLPAPASEPTGLPGGWLLVGDRQRQPPGLISELLRADAEQLVRAVRLGDHDKAGHAGDVFTQLDCASLAVFPSATLRILATAFESVHTTGFGSADADTAVASPDGSEVQAVALGVGQVNGRTQELVDGEAADAAEDDKDGRDDQQDFAGFSSSWGLPGVPGRPA